MLIDTDGGILSGYTKLALAAADRVMVPLLPNVHDANRLPVFLRQLEQLLRDNVACATVTNLIFNAIESKNNNKPTSLSPFSPASTTLGAMRQVLKNIQGMGIEYPLALATMLSTMTEDSVTSVRKGGKNMTSAAGTNVFAHTAGNAEADLRALAAKVLAAPSQVFGATQRQLAALTLPLPLIRHIELASPGCKPTTHHSHHSFVSPNSSLRPN